MSGIDVELRGVTKTFPGRYGDAPVNAVDDVSLQIYEGEFFALLGPSGCGKTTTLRLIAGFEDTTAGEILIRGRAVTHVPPFHRPVNTVFQDYALFPHMSVLQNVLFGLEMARVPRAEARQRAEQALELVQLQGAVKRKPRELSGGQQQRVALARALVNQPTVLLLDEPLGALDFKLRKAMQYELKAMQKSLGITFVFVTHDQEEAMTMADRIAVMDEGRVLQIGRPEEVYEQPATRFVADFIGETNFIEGQLAVRNGRFGSVQIDDETRVEAVLPGSVETATGAGVTLAIRPEKITLTPVDEPVDAGPGDDATLLDGIVREAVYIGTDTRYVVTIGQKTNVIVRLQNFGQRYDTIFRAGDRVNVFWDNVNARILAE
jgi:spermidine/putrescine transport system ATP-binding protein